MKKALKKKLRATVTSELRATLREEVRDELKAVLKEKLWNDAGPDEEAQVQAEMKRRRAASALNESDMEEFWGGFRRNPWVHYVHSAQEVRDYWAWSCEMALEAGGRRWTRERWPANWQAQSECHLQYAREYLRGEAEQRQIWLEGVSAASASD